MAKPTCETIAPDGLTWYGAFLRGKCISDGGLPSEMRFAYVAWTHGLSLQFTPWQDVDEGQTLSVYCTDLSYISTNDVMCQVRNADGLVNGKTIRFWLPTPTKPKEGAPWLATYQGGRFTETHYNFTMLTDIPCHLHCLVGDRKPWVSLDTHIIRGVTFHHDPELYFRWFASVTQDETGDSIIHTFTLPCPLDNVTYWLVALGTVDDLESPSICPPFSYQRTPVPEMEVLDADAITTTSAMLHGLLVKDQGAPAFVRHRYTKVDIYNQYTPIVGPYYSPKQFDQQIENLDPDTEYKFASMGSHDESMERYGWSYPKYFRTLGTPEVEDCDVHYFKSYQFWGCPVTWSQCRIEPVAKYAANSLYALWYVRGDGWVFFGRGGVFFNTSRIPAGSIITKAELHTYHQCCQGGLPYLDTYTYLVNAPGLHPAITYPDYGYLLTCDDLASDDECYDYWGAGRHPYVFHFNAAGLLNIKSGYGALSSFGFRTKRDLNNTPPPGIGFSCESFSTRYTFLRVWFFPPA